MGEYEGKNATVSLGTDALTLASKGGRLPRHIPFGAIKDVLLKDASALTDGILWLVLGDKDAPKKVGSWSATGSSDAVTFGSGKQKQFAELHAHLVRVIAANQAAEIDPTAVPYDGIEDALAASAATKLTKLNLRDDVARAASHLSDIPKTIRKALQVLSSSLGDTESVVALTAGGYGSAVLSAGAVLAVTNERVLLVAERGVIESATMVLSEVENVSWQQGVAGGRLDLSGTGRALTVRGVDHAATPAVVDLLTAIQRPKSEKSRSDVVDQLERISALLNVGALTQEEFDVQKARILAD